MEEAVRKQRVPRGGRKIGAPLGTRLNRREGRAGSAMALQVAKVRSNNRGPEGAADERTCNSGSTAGEGRHRPKPFQKWVLEERTVLWNCRRRRRKRA